MKEETYQGYLEDIKEEARRHRVPEEYLQSIHMENMFGKGKLTNSRRVIEIATIAFYKGMMSGVRHVLESERVVVLQNGEIREVDTNSPLYKLQQMKQLQKEICEYFGAEEYDETVFHDETDKEWFVNLERVVRTEGKLRVEIGNFITAEVSEDQIIRKGDMVLICEDGECCSGSKYYLVSANREKKVGE